MGGIPRYQPFAVYANVTSAEVIPEPATLFLMVFGGFLLHRQNKVVT